MAQPLFDSINHTKAQGLLLAVGLFGWVANPQPGSRKPPLGYMVAYFKAKARLQGATNHP
jgi:hypothetical protein